MDDESTSFDPKTPQPNIQYEETPVITPIEEQTPQPAVTPVEEPVTQEQQQEPPTVPAKKRSPKSIIKGFFIFLILFIIGYALSGVVRNLITQTGKSDSTEQAILTPTNTPVDILPTTAATESGLTVLPIPNISTLPTPPASSSAWKQYNPVHGTSRSPIAAIQFSLPSTVLAPVCDGSSCGSQGTYLPGGTRLTIAPRGTGEVLTDYRGKIISDASGKALLTNETTIGGKKATEYTTDTTGSTAGGYAFTTMHGYMIEVTDTLSFEINHFSPSGSTTDFAADDAIFKSIVATIKFN